MQNQESGMENEDLVPPSVLRRGTGSPEKRVLCSEELFGRGREIRIRHLGQEYRLQVTRNGKLILTK